MGVSAITAFLPSATSSLIFSTRRLDRGAEAIDNSNFLVGASNGVVAGGQARNLVAGLSGIAHTSKCEIAKDFVGAEKAIKNVVKSESILSKIDKFFKFVGKYINPVIYFTGGLSVLTAEDKKDELLTQVSGIGVMRAFEIMGNKILGFSKNLDYNGQCMVIENGNIYQKLADGSKKLLAEKGKYEILNNKTLSIKRDGLYKKCPFIGSFLEKQVNSFNDYCATKKIMNTSLKSLPSILKGILFVFGFSVAGYCLGKNIKEAIFPSKQKVAKAN